MKSLMNQWIESRGLALTKTNGEKILKKLIFANLYKKWNVIKTVFASIIFTKNQAQNQENVLTMILQTMMNLWFKNVKISHSQYA